ncbi:SDR family NAD(P)-dependent oxidoreductase [Xanthobacter autotrophicus]|uniref:SDR family NAD(P)-dependent oxidoreductase n=1 Tax=Xanthobacter autotrophicus TaxID=280 RepID=UPI0024A78C58|nr:SDR family NAD(P)-dependent oxidoreductase [Xanthobacter autotrophicus]MDI4657551.1 SDR family NAD(P)-dependent oxidoreductase [Xanthobacter autotrophicus]
MEGGATHSAVIASFVETRRLNGIDPLGAEAMALCFDVTDPKSAEAGVYAVAERWGCFDMLVNNAGFTATAPLLDMAEAGWDRIMDTNLKGASLVGKAAARAIAKRPGEAIVNVASIVGLRVTLEELGDLCACRPIHHGLTEWTMRPTLDSVHG